MNIHFLSLYHPYRNGQNAAFDHVSGMLLSFKKGEAKAVSFWLSRVEQKISEVINQQPFHIATVPSSTKGKHHPGFSLLVPKLSNSFTVLNEKGNLIKRAESIDKLATGGNRAIELHVSSLTVPNPTKEYKPVVLLDDVTTTGNSMKAAISKLERAGYTVVLAIALGKTT